MRDGPTSEGTRRVVVYYGNPEQRSPDELTLDERRALVRASADLEVVAEYVDTTPSDDSSSPTELAALWRAIEEDCALFQPKRGERGNSLTMSQEVLRWQVSMITGVPIPGSFTGYWQPRVMAHHKSDGSVAYAIHDVYFDTDNRVTDYSQHALSPLMPSPAELRDWILAQLPTPSGGVVCGDQGHAYDDEDLALWLEEVDVAPIEYEPEILDSDDQ